MATRRPGYRSTIARVNPALTSSVSPRCSSSPSPGGNSSSNAEQTPRNLGCLWYSSSTSPTRGSARSAQPTTAPMKSCSAASSSSHRVSATLGTFATTTDPSNRLRWRMGNSSEGEYSRVKCWWASMRGKPPACSAPAGALTCDKPLPDGRGSDQSHIADQSRDRKGAVSSERASLENETQSTADAAWVFHQQQLLPAHGAERKIPLRQHIPQIGGGFHAPRQHAQARNQLPQVEVQTRHLAHRIRAVTMPRRCPAMIARHLVAGDRVRAGPRRLHCHPRRSRLPPPAVDHTPQLIRTAAHDLPVGRRQRAHRSVHHGGGHVLAQVLRHGRRVAGAVEIAGVKRRGARK